LSITTPLFDHSPGPFSLIVPAYNERNRLSAALPRVFEYLRARFSQLEVIYVDDGSTDGTYEELQRYEEINPELKILRHGKNQGKGRAVRTGLEAAKGEIILFSDADFSTPIEDLDLLLQYLAQGYDIVIGSRDVPGAKVEVHQSKLREITGKIGNAIVQTLLLLPFEDTQCGFKLFRSAAIKTILPRLTIDGFAFDMEILAVASVHSMRIAEVPVTWRNVLDSKVMPKDTVQVLADVFKIRYRLAMGNYS
jgi:dolichyl-phosphate beta-glucosyltransferase